jgi:WD40 repeat protein
MSGTVPYRPDPSPLTLASWVDRACDEFEAAWRAGQRPKLEDYLANTPEPIRNTLLQELLAAEIELRRAAGEQPVPEEYAAWYASLSTHPEAISALNALFQSGTRPGSTFGASWSGSRLARDFGDHSRGGASPPRIAGYEIVKELGRGAMGVVYLARQVRLNRPCALKVIVADRFATAESVRRFLVEAETTAQLQHPNIVRIHATGDYDDCPYFELEYLDGGTLADRLDGTPWPARDAAALVVQLARALDVAHTRGIIHRDIKPSNILLTRDGVPKLADFGLAKSLEHDSHTQSGAIVGTPSYMAPEQAQGQTRAVGPAADLYALGVLIYELVTGRPPFRGTSVLETLEFVRSAEPVPPGRLVPRLSRDLETICLKCLEKEPARRFATATELVEELERFLEDRPILTRPVPAPVRLLRWCRRNRRLAVASGVAAVGLIAAAAVGTSFAVYQYHASHALQKALTETRLQRRQADALASEATLERGQTLCESGDFERGMLEMVRSLELASRAESPVLEHAARLSLADWREQAPRLHSLLEHDAEIVKLAGTADGRLVATAGNDGVISVWDVVSSRLVQTSRHRGRLRHVTFSSEGDRLLIVAGNTAEVEYLDESRRVVTIEHPDTILAAAFRPDGKAVLTAGDDGTAQLWDARSGRAAAPPIEHGEPVLAVAFSPDGTRVVTGAVDGSARVWDTRSSRPVCPPLAHPSSVLCAAFAPNGKMIALGLDEGGAQLRDATSGRAIGRPLEHRAAVDSLLFHPDGGLLATGSRDWKVRLWSIGGVADVVRAPVVLGHGAPVSAMVLSPDGKRLMTTSRDGRARIWGIPRGTLLHVLAHPVEVLSGAFGADGRSVVTAGTEPFARGWILPSPPALAIALDHPRTIHAAAFRPDGKVVATAGEDSAVRLWAVDSGTPREVLNHEGEVRGVAFRHDGRYLAAVSEDKKARWWDLEARRPVREFDHPGKPSAVAVSPDGRRLATGTREGLVALWDLERGANIASATGHRGPIWALAFSPTGSQLLSASADHSVRLWDGVTGRSLSTSWAHQGQVWAVAFDPLTHTAFSGGDDRTLLLLDPLSRRGSSTAFHMREPVRSLAVSPDGNLLLVGGRDEASAFWDIRARLAVGVRRPISDPVLASFVRAAGPGLEVVTVTENKELTRWLLPAPAAGAIGRVATEVQVATGMERDGDGVRWLDGREWIKRSEQLHQPDR